MMNQSALISVGSILGGSLPVLIAVVVVLGMLIAAPPAAARGIALWGASLILVTRLLNAVLSVLPVLMMTANNYRSADIRNFYMMLNAIHILLSLLEAAGLVMLGVALARALRASVAARR